MDNGDSDNRGSTVHVIYMYILYVLRLAVLSAMSSNVNNGNGEGLSTVGLEDSHSSLDKLMITLYGNKLLYCDGGPRDPMVSTLVYHYSMYGPALFIAWWFR